MKEGKAVYYALFETEPKKSREGNLIEIKGQICDRLMLVRENHSAETFFNWIEEHRKEIMEKYSTTAVVVRANVFNF